MNYFWESSAIYIGAKDIEETMKFYTNILGFELLEKKDNCVTYKVAGVAKLHISKDIYASNQNKKDVRMSLETLYVRSLYTKMTQEGVNLVDNPKYDESGKMISFSIKDPSNYLIEIRERDMD